MTILSMSFYGAVMILAVSVIRAFLIHKLPKKTFLILWGIVMIRLLVPISIPSALSIYTAAGRVAQPFFEQSFLQDSKGTLKQNGDLTNTAQYSGSNKSTVQNKIDFNSEVQDNAVKYNGIQYSTIKTVLFGKEFNLAVVIWMTGIIISGLSFVIPHLRCRRENRMSLPIKEEFSKSLDLNLIKVRRKIRIRQSDRIGTPFTYGILRPVIILPKTFEWSNRIRLNYVITHELMHIRHFDALVKYLLALTLCIHWFNPFVWVMYILANRDIELACDESVIHTFGERRRSAYAMTLIDMEAVKSQANILCSSFNRNSVEERIRAIMKMKKSSKAVTVLAGALVLSVTIAFTTSASPVESINAVSNSAESKSRNSERIVAITEVAEVTKVVEDAEAESLVEEEAEQEAESLAAEGAEQVPEFAGELQEEQAYAAEEKPFSELEGEFQKMAEFLTGYKAKLNKLSFEELESEYQKQVELLKGYEEQLNKLYNQEKNILSMDFRYKWDDLYKEAAQAFDAASYSLEAYQIKLDNLNVDDSNYTQLDKNLSEMIDESVNLMTDIDKIDKAMTEKISIQREKDYSKYGIKIDKDGKYYLNEEKVRYFEDGYRKTKKSFSGVLSSDQSGTVDVVITRNEKGEITNFESFDSTDTKDFIEEYYQPKAELTEIVSDVEKQ